MTFPKLALSALVLTGLLGGCAGTGHKLPQITDAERSAAIAEIDAAPALKPTDRTAEENERIARKVLARLQDVAQPVCTELGQNDCWYTLEYKRESEVNAAILKNRMVFFDGLGQYLDSEAEFAAVISHEMGHHLAKHHEERLRNRLAGAILAGLVVGALGGGSEAAGNAMKLGAAIGDISYSKEQEAEADYLAAYLMARAGYDPAPASIVWVKLAKFSGRTRTGLLDSHPAGPDRLAAWQHSVEQVRYSVDLMPNPVDGPEEERLEVARTFAPPGGQPDSGMAVAAAAAAPQPPDQSTSIPEGALGLAESAPLSGRSFDARLTWQGLATDAAGRLTLGPKGADSGRVELRLDGPSATVPTLCHGDWSLGLRAPDLSIGEMTLDCGDGRIAEGGYRVQNDGSDGLIGLQDADGKLVQIELSPS